MNITKQELSDIINTKRRSPSHWYDFLKIELDDKRCVILRATVSGSGRNADISWNLPLRDIKIEG